MTDGTPPCQFLKATREPRAQIIWRRNQGHRERQQVLRCMSQKLARLRHADCVEQCPSSKAKRRKTYARTSSSQFDPKRSFVSAWQGACFGTTADVWIYDGLSGR